MSNEKKRFLKSVIVNFISLVDKGANQKKIIFKSTDPAADSYRKVIELKKVDNDQHLVYGIVYSPDEVDSEGDFTTADVIKQMAYDFMKNRNTNNIDHQHDFNPDEGFVAESWIIEKNDPRFPAEKEGSWAVAIKVTNEDTWTKVKSGEITGLSMAGIANVEEVVKAAMDKKRNGILKSVFEKFSSAFNRIKKDFNSALSQSTVRDYVYTLENAINEILFDESIEDKKSAIMESIEQFKTAMNQIEINKETNNSNTYSNKTINNGEHEMKPEEVAQLVKDSIAEALKPFEELQKSFNELKTNFESTNTEIEKRLTTVEKAAPGSAQSAVTEDVTKSNSGYKGPNWLS